MPNVFTLFSSHLAADMLLTNIPVSLSWPFQTFHYLIPCGWTDVLQSILLEFYHDLGIILYCILVILLVRIFRPGDKEQIPETE